MPRPISVYIQLVTEFGIYKEFRDAIIGQLEIQAEEILNSDVNSFLKAKYDISSLASKLKARLRLKPIFQMMVDQFEKDPTLEEATELLKFIQSPVGQKYVKAVNNSNLSAKISKSILDQIKVLVPKLLEEETGESFDFES